MGAGDPLPSVCPAGGVAWVAWVAWEAVAVPKCLCPVKVLLLWHRRVYKWHKAPGV